MGPPVFGELPPQQKPPLPTFKLAKRSQVKRACVNCQRACKKCDDNRPCGRCTRLGIQATCADSARKERSRTIEYHDMDVDAHAHPAQATAAASAATHDSTAESDSDIDPSLLNPSSSMYTPLSASSPHDDHRSLPPRAHPHHHHQHPSGAQAHAHAFPDAVPLDADHSFGRRSIPPAINVRLFEHGHFGRFRTASGVSALSSTADADVDDSGMSPGNDSFAGDSSREQTPAQLSAGAWASASNSAMDTSGDADQDDDSSDARRYTLSKLDILSRLCDVVLATTDQPPSVTATAAAAAAGPTLSPKRPRSDCDNLLLLAGSRRADTDMVDSLRSPAKPDTAALDASLDASLDAPARTPSVIAASAVLPEPSAAVSPRTPVALDTKQRLVAPDEKVVVVYIKCPRPCCANEPPIPHTATLSAMGSPRLATDAAVSPHSQMLPQPMLLRKPLEQDLNREDPRSPALLLAGETAAAVAAASPLRFADHPSHTAAKLPLVSGAESLGHSRSPAHARSPLPVSANTPEHH
ncbi:hypothetical protein HK105_203671 [Polyrhizophydium stewartii]|uniref:Zn(2)-C6 fungal-type domain-containing protein n=1 Tax=Polyrhizophydium stewartii TaxID=2732419 RepID=A0ABR4NBN7_9FUNG